MTNNDMPLRKPKGISDKEWCDLYALLPIGNKILDENEKTIYIETIKKVISTGEYEGITLSILQAFIQMHYERR